MKKTSKLLFKVAALTVLTLGLFTGCNKKESAKKEIQNQETKNQKTYSYKMETISDVSENLEAKFVYPVFEDEELMPLNNYFDLKIEDFKITAQEYKDSWADFYTDFLPTEDNPVMSFYYNDESSVTFSGKYISILETISTYEGGPHGNLAYKSTCYDTEKKEFVDVCAVTGKTLEEIVSYCKDEIRKTVYADSDEDEIQMWLGSDIAIDNFYTKDGITTICFAPYDVASYAVGPVWVELK